MSVISWLIAIVFVVAWVFLVATFMALIIGIVALAYLLWYIDGWIHYKKSVKSKENV